jgi:hypothetical protein
VTIAQELRQELHDSLRAGYLFGRHDEPLDDAGKRLVRVIEQRIAELTDVAKLDAAFHGSVE